MASPLQGYTIEIGIGAPLSGSSARLGAEMKQAAELAVAEKNAAGGILGAAVVARSSDDRGSVSAGEAVARDFCSRAEILGVVGHYNSDVTIAVAGIYDSCGLAMVTPIASNPRLTADSRRSTFRFTNSDDQTGAAIANYLHDALKKRRAVVVESPTMYGKSMAREFTRAFSARG